MKQITSLTEEQLNQIPAVRDFWKKCALSTERISETEKQIVIENIGKLYKGSKLKEPKYIGFVSSPIVLRYVSGLTVALGQITEAKINLLNTAIISNLTQTSQTRFDTLSAVKQALKGTQNINLFPMPTFLGAKRAKKLTKWVVIDACIKELDNELNLQGKGISESQDAYTLHWQGGNQWAGWCSYHYYLRNVLKLDLDYTDYLPWEELAIHSGPRTVYEDFAFVSDRPTLVMLDEQERNHNLNGPAIKWSDGTSFYMVHGIRVPAWIIEDKDQITADLIDQEENAEVRRIMLDIYGTGKYLLAGNYEILHEDTDQFDRPRRLLRKKALTEREEDIVRVEVTNSSPELDHSFKKYLLPVDFELRPLFPNVDDHDLDAALEKFRGMTREERIREGFLGDKQEFTCHNAVASSFGLIGKDYGLPGQIRQGDVLLNFTDGSNTNKGFRES